MPWVPQAVLDELLASQRFLRAGLALRTEGAGVEGVAGSSGEASIPAPVRASRPAETEALSPMVRAAVDQYSYGDPYERAANAQIAQTMTQAGRTATEIVARLRRGAEIPEAFV
jgi:hypothetical protein